MASRALCCCEFVNAEGEIRHMLDCCYNCPEINICFERLISCKPVPCSICLRIMTATTERVRLPWLGGAKKCTIDIVIPVIALPLFLIAAAQGVWVSVIAFSFLPLFFIYLHFIYMKFYTSSYFFFAWNISSFALIFFIFEIIGVSLLEIRGDENIAFIFLTLCICFCIHKTKEKAKSSFVISECDVNVKSNILCPECNIKIPPRTYHCSICQSCILMRDQHCAWLNCCIGVKNHKWYMLFLLFSVSDLFLCANLILTTACHPIKFIGIIMLPDDCSEVYFDILYAICFVTSIYCIEAGIFVLSVFLFEVWLITLGMTGHEFRNKIKRSIFCGLCISRPYNKGILRNWLNYLKGAETTFIQYNI